MLKTIVINSLLKITIGYVRSHIVAPGVIWGIAKHALVEAGISNANTKGVGFIALPSVARSQAAVIGKGQAIWPSVNIEERTLDLPPS